MAFSSVRSALARSHTKSSTTNIPTVSKSPVREEISSTVYLLSSRTLVCLLKVLAEPFTRAVEDMGHADSFLGGLQNLIQVAQHRHLPVVPGLAGSSREALSWVMPLAL